MLEPERYSIASDLQKTDARFVLDSYFRLIKWKPHESVLDVGCGSGEVTFEILLPRLPSDFSRLVGIDIAEAMVQSAKRKLRDKRVSFRTFDVASKAVGAEFREQMNHIFSFYCLHWVQDQRAALQNMFDILKPGGDILLAYLAENPIYDIYEHLAKYPKWEPYMENWKSYCSPYHHCDIPEIKVDQLLSSVGFISHVCKTELRSYTYQNLDVLRKSVLAVVPFTEKMPEEEVDNFLDDYVKELRKADNIKFGLCNNNNEERVTMVYKILVVFASKLM